MLLGPEVKVVKQRGLRLDDAYVKLIDGEPYLLNAEIPAYKYASRKDYDPKRSRKLLLHKKELVRIQTKLKGGSGLTIAPISCYNKGDLIKLEIAIARGRKDVEKRKQERRKAIERQLEREVKGDVGYR